VTASGTTDEPTTRDFQYYVAFVHSGDEVSVASNLTLGTLDYYLGDVTDGSTAGQGDNAVNMADMSLLGAHYGIEGVEAAAYPYLDVGPTTDYTTDALPLTDGVIDFEDLIVFAIDVDAVSAPALVARARPAPPAARGPVPAAAGQRARGRCRRRGPRRGDDRVPDHVHGHRPGEGALDPDDVGPREGAAVGRDAGGEGRRGRRPGALAAARRRGRGVHGRTAVHGRGRARHGQLHHARHG
jgi:hypothetical protein